jgi:adenylyl cyclase-associated protein
MSEFHSLANLIKRLEVATTRLEDLAMSSSSASAVSATVNTTTPNSSPHTGAQSSADTKQVPAVVEKHDATLYPPLEKFITLSSDISELVASQVNKKKKNN